MTAIPPLTRDCNSWVVTPPVGRAIELFTMRNVEKAAAAGWQIETASDYLHRINREIQEGKRRE